MSAALALVPEVVAGEFDAAPDSDDLNYTPQLDVEAQTLCALLWASPEVARTVVDVLTAGDFYRPVYGELFTVIARLVTEARPHSSVLVLSELQRGGKVSGLLSRALTEVTLADAREHEISHYARAVLAQSYRRGYAAAAATLAQLAEEASEDELSASCPQWEHKPAFHNVTDMSVSHWFASRNRLNSVVGDEVGMTGSDGPT